MRPPDAPSRQSPPVTRICSPFDMTIGVSGEVGDQAGHVVGCGQPSCRSLAATWSRISSEMRSSARSVVVSSMAA